MGTYRVSVIELKDIVWEALDNVEGDFDRATLIEALEICKDYHPVIDEDSTRRRSKRMSS